MSSVTDFLCVSRKLPWRAGEHYSPVPLGDRASRRENTLRQQNMASETRPDKSEPPHPTHAQEQEVKHTSDVCSFSHTVPDFLQSAASQKCIWEKGTVSFLTRSFVKALFKKSKGNIMKTSRQLVVQAPVGRRQPEGDEVRGDVHAC